MYIHINTNIHLCIYLSIYIYVCVCVCVLVLSSYHLPIPPANPLTLVTSSSPQLTPMTFVTDT